MRLTIEIPDHEVRRLLGPIFRTVEMEPSPPAVDKVDGLRVLSSSSGKRKGHRHDDHFRKKAAAALCGASRDGLPLIKSPAEQV